MAIPLPVPTVGWVVEISICKKAIASPLASPRIRDGVNNPVNPAGGMLAVRSPSNRGCGTIQGMGTPTPTPADPASTVDTVTVGTQ